MMHMTFYWSKEVTLLLDSWRTESWTSYSLTLLACLISSAFYQYMEDRRVRFKLVSVGQPSAQIETPFLRGKLRGGGPKLSAARIGGAALFGFNSAVGYLLMLAVMSFNGGIFLAVVLGLAIGYLLFRSGDEDLAAPVLDNPCACA
ncbi:copper transporter 5.1-like [Juglans regia]|uniref:Copper transport protein n=1 Tax=Juglans regia TaxID=51240 RepID=A0A2I4HQ64_JUGRE|nr:copper transporter 5.1-like [Juglans regia]